MRTETVGGTLFQRDTYEAIFLNQQEAATLRKAENLLYRILNRVGAEAREHHPDLAHLDDHDLALEVLPEDDPLASAAAFLSESNSWHGGPGSGHGEYHVPGSDRETPRRGS